VTKYVAFIRKQPDMSRQDFEAKWLGGHASIVKRFPKLRRYTITFFQDGQGEQFIDTNLDLHNRKPTPAELVGWDGYAEIWFDSREDFEAAHESEIWAVEASGDRSNFIGEFISAPVKAEHRMV
jgi:EthD domain